MSIRALFLTLGSVTVLISGCSSLPERLQSEQSLVTRASTYYDALVQGDYQSAYTHFSPGYRATYSFVEHMMINPPQGKYLAATVDQVHCTIDIACDVSAQTMFEFAKGFQPLGGMVVPRDQTTRWLYTDDNWYLVPRR